MAIIPLEVTNYPTGATIYAFPSDADLANYVADKVQLVEDPAPNLGRYRCNWDTADGTSVSVFAGATQPASWEDAITGLGFDLSSEIAATQATAAALDASKIPRLLNPIAAGASAIETWIVTVDSRGTLISTKAYS